MSVGRTSWLACATIVAIPLLARAGGDPGGGPLAVTLDYDVAPGCPELRDFKTVVADRLGYDPFRENAPDHVLVRITPRGRAIDGRLEWRDAAGHWVGDHTFPSRGDCRELVRAMGFALALQIQLLAIAAAPPDASSEGTPATGRLEEPPPPPVSPPPPVVPPSSEPPRKIPDVVDGLGASRRHAPSTLSIGAGAAVGFGLSSSPILVGRLFGAIAWPHASFELGGELSLPATTRRADGAGFSQQELLVSATGCGALERWSACLLAKAGQIRIVGLGIDVPASPSGGMLETGFRLGLTQRLGRRIFLAPHADALVNLTRWTVTLDGLPVWTAPRFAATMGLDAGLRFP